MSRLIDEIFSYLHGWIIMHVNGQLCAKHWSFSKLVLQFFEVIFLRPIFENFSWYLFILHRWIILCLDCALSKFHYFELSPEVLVYNQFLEFEPASYFQPKRMVIAIKLLRIDHKSWKLNSTVKERVSFQRAAPPQNFPGSIISPNTNACNAIVHFM